MDKNFLDKHFIADVQEALGEEGHQGDTKDPRKKFVFPDNSAPAQEEIHEQMESSLKQY